MLHLDAVRRAFTTKYMSNVKQATFTTLVLSFCKLSINQKEAGFIGALKHSHEFLTFFIYICDALPVIG